MSDFAIPIVLAVVGLIVALNAYRNIRRGAARHYTLEREALLRQASFTVIASAMFFLAAVAMLIFNMQTLQQDFAIENGEIVEGAITPSPTLSIFPPTPSVTPTVDGTLPTPTVTPIVRRAVVEGTGGNGLYLRESPGGPEITILPEGTNLTVVDEPPQTVDGLNWLLVRTIAGDEGWVSDTFLIMSER
jgi:hypothetical protein